VENIMVISTIVSAIAGVVIAVATVVYVRVTRKLWQATLDTARRTEELARHANDTFLLQAVIAYQEQIRWAQEVKIKAPEMFGAADAGVRLFGEFMTAAFPERKVKIVEVFSRTVEAFEKSGASKM
jgi:hypothetical protein